MDFPLFYLFQPGLNIIYIYIFRSIPATPEPLRRAEDEEDAHGAQEEAPKAHLPQMNDKKKVPGGRIGEMLGRKNGGSLGNKCRKKNVYMITYRQKHVQLTHAEFF